MDTATLKKYFRLLKIELSIWTLMILIFLFNNIIAHAQVDPASVAVKIAETTSKISESNPFTAIIFIMGLVTIATLVFAYKQFTQIVNAVGILSKQGAQIDRLCANLESRPCILNHIKKVNE